MPANALVADLAAPATADEDRPPSSVPASGVAGAGGASASTSIVPERSLDVLVVDDDEAGAKILALAVEGLGHRCRLAHDGEEAWAMQKQRPADVVLSDWRMPKMNGVELCRRIRQAQAEGEYTYFIFMTGLDDKEHLLEGMRAGADDYHTKPLDLDELQARLVSATRVVSLYRRLADTNKALKRDSQTSFHAARTDPLTNVANRLRMDEDLDVARGRATRYGHRYCVAICDIDFFKQYNDTFGHLAGDDALRQVADTIRNELRQSDGLYRYGGEEFLAILPEQTLADAAHAMDRVRRQVERLGLHAPVKPGGAGREGGDVVTISIGIAELHAANQETLKDWLARADAALYRAKSNGRNRVVVDGEVEATEPITAREVAAPAHRMS